MRKKRFVSPTSIIGCRKLDTQYKSLIYFMNNKGGVRWDLVGQDI